MAQFICKTCGTKASRRGKKQGVFCSLKCKSEHQRQKKPVTREWLARHYTELGMSTYAIAKIVSRNPKQVFNWLVDLGIPTRQRTWSATPDPEKRLYQNQTWLMVEYILKGRTASEIAKPFGVTTANVLFFLRRAGVAGRSMSETRAIKKWGSSGPANGMYGRTGESNPNWNGGCSPERQDFYSSQEWKKCKRIVWKRDKGRCQRCECEKNLEYHHIVSFAVKELRAVSTNVTLLCDKCHDFVHSNKNTKKDFIFDGRDERKKLDRKSRRRC